MKPQIDKLYIYKQRDRSVFYAGFKELDQRLHENDFKFMRGNIPDKSDNVYRYAETVGIGEAHRTFLLITQDADKERVAKFFDKLKKDIAADPKQFKAFKNAGSQPVETSFTYDY